VYRHLVAALAVVGLLVASSPAWSQTAERPAKGISRASLGIAVEPTAKDNEPGVLVVRQVFPDSPAAKAGMKEGDVIAKVGDRDVKDYDALVNFLATHKPGDKVTFQVKRDGQERSVTVTLATRQAAFGEPGGVQQAGGTERPKELAFLGVQTAAVNELPPQLRGRFKVTEEKGVVVTDVLPNSPAAKAGLRTGDVITGVDKQPISRPPELRQAVQNAGVGKSITVTAKRGDQTMEIKAQLEESPIDQLGQLPRLPGAGGSVLRPVGPGVFEAPEQIRQLQQRIDDLEKRVKALEKRQ
jgi:S1-C subfamily serine protease